MQMHDGIPVLDLLPLMAGETGVLAGDFADAYGGLGFAYVSNHFIDEALIESVLEANRAFHARPMEEKMKVALSAAHRGYIPPLSSTDVTSDLAEVIHPNQSESFMVMREDAVADPQVYLSGPNQWPDLAGFRTILEAYVKQMTNLGQRLMQVALRASGASDMSGMEGFETPTTWLRLLHYPGQPDAPEGVYGSAPHRDFGALTLLAQDRTGGLEVQDPAGDWHPVPPLPGALVLNVGDMLARMSNGRLRATPHRVINRAPRERHSAAFFYDPHVNTVIAPLPGTGESQYPPLLYADFLKGQLEASYDRHAQG